MSKSKMSELNDCLKSSVCFSNFEDLTDIHDDFYDLLDDTRPMPISCNRSQDDCLNLMNRRNFFDKTSMAYSTRKKHTSHLGIINMHEDMRSSK